MGLSLSLQLTTDSNAAKNLSLFPLVHTLSFIKNYLLLRSYYYKYRTVPPMIESVIFLYIYIYIFFFNEFSIYFNSKS